MKDVIIFACIVIFTLVPFGYGVVWFLYRKTIVFPVAMTVFISSMFTGIVSFAISEFGWYSLIWAIPLCLVALVAANGVFKVLIQRPLKEHKAFLDQMALEGNLDFEQRGKFMKYKNELGDIFRSFHKLGINLRQTADFADKIAQSNFTADYKVLGDDDKIGQSLLNMRHSLVNAKEAETNRKMEEEQQNWITNGIAKFSEILRQQNTNIEDVSYLLISNLVDYVGATQGALFILDESNDDDMFYEMTGAVAYGREKSFEVKFNLGEGLVGRCAYEQESIYMTDVPENYVKITSGLGKSNPRSILLIPAILNDKVYAVIELVAFDKFDDYKIEFIEKLGETIASTISSVKVNERTQNLLEESKHQSEELAAQEEEMRQSLEELQATQEELTRVRKEDAEKNEKALAQVEKHRTALLRILDYVPMKIFLKDSNCNMLIVNQKVLDIHENTREELLGKNDFDFIDDQELAQKFFDDEQALIKSGKIDVEIHPESVGHTEYMLETTKTPFYIDYLDETGILGVQLDITEKTAMEKRIKELEEELAKLKS